MASRSGDPIRTSDLLIAAWQIKKAKTARSTDLAVFEPIAPEVSIDYGMT